MALESLGDLDHSGAVTHAICSTRTCRADAARRASDIRSSRNFMPPRKAEWPYWWRLREQLFEPDRQLPDALAGGVMDGIRHDRVGADVAKLAQPLDAERLSRSGTRITNTSLM